MQTDNVRKLRAEKTLIEQELIALKDAEKERHTQQTKRWEQTCDDLTKELTNAHDEIAEREQTSRKLEGELNRLNDQIADAKSAKINQ